MSDKDIFNGNISQLGKLLYSFGTIQSVALIMIIIPGAIAIGIVFSVIAFFGRIRVVLSYNKLRRCTADYRFSTIRNSLIFQFLSENLIIVLIIFFVVTSFFGDSFSFSPVYISISLLAIPNLFQILAYRRFLTIAKEFSLQFNEKNKSRLIEGINFIIYASALMILSFLLVTIVIGQILQLWGIIRVGKILDEDYIQFSDNSNSSINEFHLHNNQINAFSPKFCSKCGHRVELYTNFCTYCGEKL